MHSGTTLGYGLTATCSTDGPEEDSVCLQTRLNGCLYQDAPFLLPFVGFTRDSARSIAPDNATAASTTSRMW